MQFKVVLTKNRIWLTKVLWFIFTFFSIFWRITSLSLSHPSEAFWNTVCLWVVQSCLDYVDVLVVSTQRTFSIFLHGSTQRCWCDKKVSNDLGFWMIFSLQFNTTDWYSEWRIFKQYYRDDRTARSKCPPKFDCAKIDFKSAQFGSCTSLMKDSVLMK